MFEIRSIRDYRLVLQNVGTRLVCECWNKSWFVWTWNLKVYSCFICMPSGAVAASSAVTTCLFSTSQFALCFSSSSCPRPCLSPALTSSLSVRACSQFTPRNTGNPPCRTRFRIMCLKNNVQAAMLLQEVFVDLH